MRADKVSWLQQDNLAMGAIRFLTIVAKGIHHGLFQDDKVLQQVRDSRHDRQRSCLSVTENCCSLMLK